MRIKKSIILLLIILTVAGFFRFYNLMHDDPFFFNPDERNMAIAITQFRLPSRLSQISTNNFNLNPRFYAYGQFPLYLSYVSDQITKPFINFFLRQPATSLPAEALAKAGNQPLTTNIPSAIFWLRFWSALASTLTVLIVYLITKQLLNNKGYSDNFDLNFPFFAAIFAAFSPGLIQSAHFGTTESLLTFFFMASVYLSIKLSYLSNLGYLCHLKTIVLLSLTIGLAIGSKLTGLFFFVPPAISLMVQVVMLFRKRKRKKSLVKGLLGYWVIGLLVFIISLVFAVLSSPYNLIDKQSFLGAVFGYERDVAMGKYEAFYTRQFTDTTPVLFQMEKVFPYALGWPVFILGSLGLLFMSSKILLNCSLFIFQSIKYHVLRIRGELQNNIFILDSPHRAAILNNCNHYLGASPKYKKEKNNNILNTYYLILTTSFLFYFLPNAFLFAKWTRFMTPVFPFFSIFASYLLFKFYHLLGYCLPAVAPILSGAKAGVIGLLVFISMLPGLAFMSIYTHEDSRVTASKWIYQNIPNNSYVLSETANVIDIPLGIPDYKLKPETYNLTVISFDFYHTDENRALFNQLLSHIQKADYIFIPSRRIFTNFQRFPDKYPLVNKYYQLLFSGDLGFEKVAEINSFPGISFISYHLSFPDESAEETSTVFDHPVIRIYRKVKPLTKEQYGSLFKI